MYRLLALLPLLTVSLASADEWMNFRITQKRIVNRDPGFFSYELQDQIEEINRNLVTHGVQRIPHGEVLQKGRIYSMKDFVAMSFTQAKMIMSQDYCAIIDGNDNFYRFPNALEKLRGKKEVSLSGDFAVHAYYEEPLNVSTSGTKEAGSDHYTNIISTLSREYFLHDAATKKLGAMVDCYTTLKAGTVEEIEKKYEQYKATGTFGPLREAFRK